MKRHLAMNFDRALVTYPDGRLASLTPAEFYAIPLARANSVADHHAA